MSNLFDTRAQTWDEQPRRVKMAADIFAALERSIPLQPDMEVLDYGAGTGLLTLALAPRVRRIQAVDSSSGMLEVLARKVAAAGIRNVDLKQADFTTDPPPPGPYHLITSAMTLHHVAAVDALLQTFFHLLGAGGTLALADLDAEDGAFHSDHAGIAHFGFARDVLAQQLAAAGFVDIRFTTAARIEKETRAYPVFLAAARRP